MQTSLYRYAKHFEEQLLVMNKNDMEAIYIHTMNHGELWRSLAAEHSLHQDIMVHFVHDCTS